MHPRDPETKTPFDWIKENLWYIYIWQTDDITDHTWVTESAR